MYSSEIFLQYISILTGLRGFFFGENLFISYPKKNPKNQENPHLLSLVRFYLSSIYHLTKFLSDQLKYQGI